MSRSLAPDVFAPSGCLSPDLFTGTTFSALQAALHLTRQTQWDTVRSPHLFMGLLAAPDACIRAWATHWEADIEQLLVDFRNLFHLSDGIPDAPLVLNREFFSDNVIRVLREGLQRARVQQRPRITPTDLLVSVLSTSNSIVAECFQRIGVIPARLTELAIRAESSNNPASS